MGAFIAAVSKEPVPSEKHHTHLLQLLTCAPHHIKTSPSLSINGRQHNSTLKDYRERIRADGAAGIIVINDGLSSVCRSMEQRASCCAENISGGFHSLNQFSMRTT